MKKPRKPIPTTCPNCGSDDLIVSAGVVRCLDWDCATIVDTSNARPGLIEANQFR